MKLTEIFLTLGCLIAVAGEASAADWWFVPAEPDQDRSAAIYVEKSSMLRARGTGTVSTQVWTIYRSDRSGEFGGYRSAKMRVTVDCERQELGSNAGSFYSAFGGLVHQERLPQPAMTPIQPKSLQEIMAAFLCSDGKKPTRSLPVYDPNRDAEQRFLQYDRERPAKPAGQPG